MYKIEKMPPPPRNGGRPRKYPFHDMKVGDSVRFESAEEFERARNAAYQHGWRFGWVFICRRDERRVWRVK